MNTLGKLEQLLMAGEITEEEYKKKKTIYIETLLELYIKDIITEEETAEWAKYKGLNRYNKLIPLDLHMAKRVLALISCLLFRTWRREFQLV